MKKNRPIKVGIVGVAGKMGKAIASIIINDPKTSLVAGSEYSNHKLLGKDIGVILGSKPINIFITDNIKDFFKDLDVVIEFGLEKATNKFLKEASKNKVAFLSGSTGLSSNTLNLMKRL